MSKLSREQVLKLAKLSRLRLTEDEIKKYQEELSNILDYVEQLKKIDTTGLEPTFQVTGLTSVMREDIVKLQQSKPEKLLEGVPRRKDNYIQVNRMI